MRAKVRQVLDVIEDALLVGDDAAADLAAILTALRGPDSLRYQYRKGEATVPIRRAAFPRIAKACDMFNSRYGMSDPTPRVGSERFMSFGNSRCNTVKVLNELEYPPSGERHFERHILAAVKALQADEHADKTTTTLQPRDWRPGTW